MSTPSGGRGSGRHHSAPGRGRGHAPSTGANTGYRRPYENGTSKPTEAGAGTVTAQENAAPAGAQPKPAGGGWGSGKSFASIVKTQAAAPPKAAPDGEGNREAGAKQGAQPPRGDAAANRGDTPTSEAPTQGVPNFGSFEGDKDKGKEKEREGNRGPPKHHVPANLQDDDLTIPRKYLRTESAPPGTGPVGRPNKNPTFIPLKTRGSRLGSGQRASSQASSTGPSPAPSTQPPASPVAPPPSDLAPAPPPPQGVPPAQQQQVGGVSAQPPAPPPVAQAIPQAVAAAAPMQPAPPAGAPPAMPQGMPAMHIPAQQPAAPPPRHEGKGNHHHPGGGYPGPQHGRVQPRGGDGHHGPPQGPRNPHYGSNPRQQGQPQQHVQQHPQQMPAAMQYTAGFQPGGHMMPMGHMGVVYQQAPFLPPGYPQVVGPYPGSSPPTGGMMHPGMPPHLQMMPPHVMMAPHAGGQAPMAPPPPPPQPMSQQVPPAQPQQGQQQHVVMPHGGPPAHQPQQQAPQQHPQQPLQVQAVAGPPQAAVHHAPAPQGPTGAAGAGAGAARPVPTPHSAASQAGSFSGGSAGAATQGAPTGVTSPGTQPRKGGRLRIVDPNTGGEVQLPVQPPEKPAASTPAPAASPAPPAAAPAAVAPFTPVAAAKPGPPRTAAREIKAPTPEAIAKSHMHHHKTSSGASAAAAAAAAAAPTAAAPAAAPGTPTPAEAPAPPAASTASTPQEPVVAPAKAVAAAAAPEPAAVEAPVEPPKEAEAPREVAPEVPAPTAAAAPAATAAAAEPEPATAAPAATEAAVSAATEAVTPAAPEPEVAEPEAAAPAVQAAQAVPSEVTTLPSIPEQEPVAGPVAAAAAEGSVEAEAAPSKAELEAPAKPDEAPKPVEASLPSEPVATKIEETGNGTAEAAASAEGAQEGPASQEPAEDAAEAAAAAAPPKKKHGIKDVGRRGDARDDQLRDAADPFAKKAPQEAITPAQVPAVKALKAAAAAERAYSSQSQQQSPERPSREEVVSDNWESAAEEDAISTRPSASAPQPPLDGRKIYTADYMKSIGGSRLFARPPGLDQAHGSFLWLEPEAKMFDSSSMANLATLHSVPSMGRTRSGMGRPGDDGWARGKGPQGGGQYGQLATQGSGNVRPRPDRQHSQQIADGKWARGQPLPPQSPGGRGGRQDSMIMARGASGQLPALHRTDNRFVAGQVQSDDPDEEKRQKQFQGILNKITPDNFERLTNKCVEEVGIPDRRTLEGLIDKIFDKALTDTHFCELYSRMCKELSTHPKCPKFENPEGGKPIDLRRLLLYKCQEEFEKGVKAMVSVDEREAKGEDDDQQGDNKPGEEPAAGQEREEGELSPERDDKPRELTAAEKRAQERRAAEEDRAARRRMLGNIQFIGYLYKAGLITERILHSCITTLLRETDSPRPEDVECLSKLLTTVGAQLDHTNKPEFAKVMSVYFDRLQRLRSNQKLESRIRFMIQDVLDLRANNWVPRTKKEGPKKIADVHQEAQQELLAQQMRDREEMRRGGGGGDRRGAPMPPPQRSTMFDRVSRDELPNRTLNMQRATSSELQTMQFRPGGAFGRTARNASPNPAAASAAASGRSTPTPQQNSPFATASSSQQPSRQASMASMAPPAPKLDRQQTRTSVESMVKDFFTTKSEDVLQVLAGLRSRGADMGLVLHLTLTEALEQRGVEFSQRITPFVGVFQEALQKPPAEGGMSAAELEAGGESILKELHGLIDDQPKAPEVLGPFLAEFVAGGHMSLGKLLRVVLEVPPVDEDVTDPPLVDAGGASSLLTTLMTRLKELQGEEGAAKAWAETGLDAVQFHDEFAREEPDKIKEQLTKDGLGFLVPS